MKQLVCIFFSAIILFTPVYNAGVWLDYELNKAEIAEAYCENKDKPELHCEGSCHVQKTLITQDQNQPIDQAENWVPSMARSIVFMQAIAFNSSFAQDSQNVYPANDETKLSDWQADIFHPPLV